MKALFARINSGKFRGKKLQLPSLKTTRSTKSLVRSSFFDTMRYELMDKVFIEGFGGSALMAAEAISNGAKSAFAIEFDNEAFKLTSKNTKSLEVDNLKAIRGDCFKILPELISNTKDKILLYLDPPFNSRDGFSEIYTRLCELIKTLDKDKIYMIVFEHSSDYTFSSNIASFELKKQKKLGNTTLSYFS